MRRKTKTSTKSKSKSRSKTRTSRAKTRSKTTTKTASSEGLILGKDKSALKALVRSLNSKLKKYYIIEGKDSIKIKAYKQPEKK